MGIDEVSIIAEVAEGVNKGMSEYAAAGIKGSIIGGIFGGLSIFVANWLITRLKTKGKNKTELKLLIGELTDLKRHFEFNMEILKSIRVSHDMIPSRIHLEKMKVSPDSIIYSAETHRNIHYRYSAAICRIKLVIRNLDITINAILDYMAKDTYDYEVMEKYIDYLAERTDYSKKLLLSEISKLKETYKKRGNRKSVAYQPQPEQPDEVFRIIYEKI